MPNYSVEQVVNQVLDRTNPSSPSLRTSGGSSSSVTVSTPVDQAAASVGTSSAQVIAADASRVQLTLRNTGSVDAWVQHGAAAQVGRGYIVQAGGERSFSGALAVRQWFGIVASGSTNLSLGGGA